MPSSTEILEGLHRIANTWLAISVLWHLALGAAVLAYVFQAWRPSARTAALATVLPLVSVSSLAWLDRNPFTGSVFALAAIVLAAFSRRITLHDVQPASEWEQRTGAALILFGWFYPHFLEAHSLWLYAIAAPLGLIPCPTLSVVIGLSLYFGAFGSRAWGVATGVLGLFYGLFGIARLGVWLDLPLLAGAITALVASSRRRHGALIISH
jgi:hypothetical protein